MTRIPAFKSLFSLALALSLTICPSIFAGRIGLASGWHDTDELPGLDSTIEQTRTRAHEHTNEVLALVQFSGPIQPEWIEECEGLGATICTSVPEFAYLVRTTPDALSAIQNMDSVEWVGFLPSQFRISPDLNRAVDQASTQSADHAIPVTILSVDDLPGRWLRQRGIALTQNQSERLRWRMTRATLTPEMIAEVSSLWSVFHIEPTSERQLMGERAAQVAAGNYLPGAPAPTAPGYAAWLASNGLQGGPGLIVQVSDDGLDQGIATNAPGTAHPDILGRIAGIFNPGSDPLGDSADGHGQINVGIIVGDATVGTTGPGGYLLGQGLAPMAQVYGTKIFINGGFFDIGSYTDEDLAEDAQSAGVTFSNNSWGAPVGGAYTVDSAIYDALVRDANQSVAGNQPITYFFSAGNSGPNAGSLGTPGTAKNVISVGATENSDADGTDECGWDPTDADDIQDLAVFSSRGPADDGRIGVTVVAVGTHVQGPVSTHAEYNGSGVCGLWPMGQTDYARSTGTSHSCPVACGAGMIVHEIFSTLLAPNGHTANPSPALIKAVLTNTATDLAGNGDGNGGIIDHVPSTDQGWGSVNLSTLLDMQDGLYSFDQEHLFTGSGQSWEIPIAPVDPNLPLKITLVWTDAPGNPLVSPTLVNDLNLAVTNSDGTYLGNVFSEGHSITGGSADTLNNIEAVYIESPAGFHTVRVDAFNIADDGVPGNGTALDQDFALFVWNGVTQTSAAYADIDRDWVNDGASFTVTLSDADLRGAGTAFGVLTSGYGDFEVLTMPESPAGSGFFRSTVTVHEGQVSPFSGDIETLHGDTILFTRFDSDDGTGSPLIASDITHADFVAPTIANLSVTSINPTRVAVEFDTDEPAASSVAAGLDLGVGLHTAEDDLGTDHQLVLDGLIPCTTYLVSIEATDRAGNVATNTNGGLSHTVQTLDLTTSLSDDFEGADQGWTTTGQWHLNDDTSAFNEANSPTHSYWFGQESTGFYAVTGESQAGQLRSPPIDNPVSLTFQSWEQTEDYEGVDTMIVYVEAEGTSTEVHQTTIDDGTWHEIGPIDLTAFSDQTVNIVFEFDTVDELFNDFRGWYIDDVTVMSQIDCTSNHPPVSTIDLASTVVGAPVTVEVLLNDTDIDIGDSLTVTSITQPENGTAVINAGASVTYTPDLGFSGLDAFTYAVRDMHGGADTERVEIQVGPIPDVSDIVEHILGVTPGDPDEYDVNSDSTVDAADVVRRMMFLQLMPTRSDD